VFSPKCPNCGLVTKRTEDWVCQWCGYPLLSRSFPKIAKTYQQLKQEQEDHKQTSDIIEEMTPVSKAESTATEAVQHSGEYESTTKMEPILSPDTPVSEITIIKTPTANKEEATKSDQVKEVEEEDTTVPIPDQETVHETKEKVATHQYKHDVKTVNQAEIKVETDIKEELPEAKPSPTQKITIDELFRNYEQDSEATDKKLANQVIQVTGVVGRIEIKDTIDTPYITLTSDEAGQLQSLRCSFGKDAKPELSRLNRGDIVTVLGDYDGSIIDPRMKNCHLIQEDF
jgi:hypothetical protein